MMTPNLSNYFSALNTQFRPELCKLSIVSIELLEKKCENVFFRRFCFFLASDNHCMKGLKTIFAAFLRVLLLIFIKKCITNNINENLSSASKLW